MSSSTLGRDTCEEPCDIRPAYQRDRDRILHSKAFRRLKDKTQVFLAPEGDHYRTRLTHTLEVAQIARTIAGALKMNESLTEAIALGHDLGHTPFGHSGEYILNEICPDGFSHYRQSVRIVEVLEKKGKGLNLTKEVRDGILNHRTAGSPATLEGNIVRLSDKIAYINHIIGNSLNRPQIVMSADVEQAMKGLRQWMFDNVYCNPAAKGEEGRAQQLILRLYEYYMKHTDSLPEEYLVMMEHRQEKKERVVCDYIAGMSDRYTIDQFEELFLPKARKV